MKSEINKLGTSHFSQTNQLKRIEGQVRGVLNMIDEKRYCIDILRQLKAIRSSISTVEKRILEEHLDCCVSRAVKSKSKNDSQVVIDEIKALVNSVKF